MDLVHVTVCRGGGFLRTAAALTRAQIRRVPIGPVVFGMCLFVIAVMLLCLPQKRCRRRHVQAEPPSRQPAGDFLSVLTLPYFAPVPGEYAANYQVGDNYSGHVVGSGPTPRPPTIPDG